MSHEENAPEFRPVAVECGKPSLSQSRRENDKTGREALLPRLVECRKRIQLKVCGVAMGGGASSATPGCSPIRRGSPRFVAAYPRFIGTDR